MVVLVYMTSPPRSYDDNNHRPQIAAHVSCTGAQCTVLLRERLPGDGFLHQLAPWFVTRGAGVPRCGRTQRHFLFLLHDSSGTDTAFQVMAHGFR